MRSTQRVATTSLYNSHFFIIAKINDKNCTRTAEEKTQLAIIKILFFEVSEKIVTVLVELLV